MIEAVRLEEHVFSGETQVGALHKIVFVAGVFQNVAEADILREEAGDRGRGVAFKRRKQRDAALRGDHPGDSVVGARQLGGVAEIEAFAFQFAKLGRQVGKRLVIKIGALKAFAVDIDQVELGVGDAFRRLFIVGNKIRIAVAGLGFHQLANLAERRTGVNGGQRENQRQQAIAKVVRMMTASAEYPAQGAENAHQRHDNPGAGKDIFADARAGQAVGQGIKHRVINAVAGEIIAGVESDVEDHKQAQHR